MIVVFLAACTVVILVKALRKDLAIDDEEESGWKMINGDVFHPPSTSPMALSVLIGLRLPSLSSKPSSSTAASSAGVASSAGA
jgi:hypothetical protein